MSTEFEQSAGAMQSTQVRTRKKTAHAAKTSKLPPHAVILHNDDLNTFEFVVEVIIKVFHYPMEKAVLLMLEAHHTGRSIVWSGSKEVAELKADQIRSCGADPVAKELGAQPLQVTIEPQ